MKMKLAVYSRYATLNIKIARKPSLAWEYSLRRNLTRINIDENMGKVNFNSENKVFLFV